MSIQLSAGCLKLCANLGTTAPSTAASLANSHVSAIGCKRDERKCWIQEKLLLATVGEHRTSNMQDQGSEVIEAVRGLCSCLLRETQQRRLPAFI